MGLSADSNLGPVSVAEASASTTTRSCPSWESNGRSRSSWGWLSSARSPRGKGATGAEISFLSGAPRCGSSRDARALVEVRSFLFCLKSPETRERSVAALTGAFPELHVFPLVEGAMSLPSWAIVFSRSFESSYLFLFIWAGGEGG